METIVRLQKTLDQLQAARAQLEGIPDWMEELHAEYSAARGEIDELQQTVDEARRERRDSEAVVADAQVRLRQLQEQIGLVRNQREYGALLHEIDVVKGQIRDAEEAGLGALERQDEGQQPLSERQQAFADLERRYREALEKWETEKPEMASHAERLGVEVEELRGQLGKGVLIRFDRIRERYAGRALAEVKAIERGRLPTIWHCAECNYRVRPQALQQIQNDGSIVLCDSCKRILFLPDGDEG